MKKNTAISLILPALLCLTVMYGCRKSASTENGTIQEDDNNITLLKGMSVGTMNLNDTANNIKGKIIFPRNLRKESGNVNVDPAVKFITDNLHVFANNVKNRENKDTSDANYYLMSIKSFWEQDDIISVAYDKKEHYSGKADTVKTVVTFNYNKETEQPLDFFDVFNVNNTDLDQFNKAFNSAFTLAELKDIGFYFDKDNLWLYCIKADSVYKTAQPKKKVKKFMIND